MSKLDTDLRNQRDKDLMAAYRKVAPYCWTQNEAWERASKSVAPRYYTSVAHANYILSPMTHGDNSRIEKLANSNLRRMYYSLWNKVLELSVQREYVGKSLRYIVSFAIGQSAPEFFLAPRSVRLTFLREKRCKLSKRRNGSK